MSTEQGNRFYREKPKSEKLHTMAWLDHVRPALQIIAVSILLWFVFIGISRFEPFDSDCHQRGDAMIKMMEFNQ